ncbi:MAG: OmpA family protein [Reyranella sp.]|nr:OmpA family protein [Reyranella sp.]
MNRSTLAALVVALALGSAIAGTTPLVMAQTAEDPARDRLELFAKLRAALAGQRDMQVVGDRFVIPSELLFQSGAAVIQPAGEKLLATVARRLIEVSAQIPKDTAWVLQVDGHTDSTPIHNSLYPSNWELSSARAIAVVKFLNGAGVPNERLVAAGYSQYQPLSTIDRARNRRVELKFTNR